VSRIGSDQFWTMLLATCVGDDLFCDLLEGLPAVEWDDNKTISGLRGLLMRDSFPLDLYVLPSLAAFDSGWSSTVIYGGVDDYVRVRVGRDGVEYGKVLLFIRLSGVVDGIKEVFDWIWMTQTKIVTHFEGSRVPSRDRAPQHCDTVCTRHCGDHSKFYPVSVCCWGGWWLVLYVGWCVS